MPFDRETSGDLNPGDASSLAATVRALAGRAHRVLAGSCSSHDLRDLLWRIRRLQRQIRHRPLGDLHRWLENLRQRVATLWHLSVLPADDESPHSPTAA